jgi:hypothetical protein
VAADDASWEPINGISLQHYAELAREAQARGITDEAGMITLAQERGWKPADTNAAPRRLGAADEPVDGRRTAVPQVPWLLTGACPRQSRCGLTVEQTNPSTCEHLVDTQMNRLGGRGVADHAARTTRPPQGRFRYR